jgi:hypothetical protein
MHRDETAGLNRRAVERLLSKAARARSTADRMEVFSRCLVGLPYTPDPLIGSIDTREVFTISLEGFDCVTYLETVLALALASTPDTFVRMIRRIRYAQGRISWERRNHYMTDWIRNNARQGLMKLVSVPGVPTVRRERLLDVVAGLAPRRICVECVPKRAVARIEGQLRTGDMIFFASTRRNLDVFHAGILVRSGDQIAMRHASRSQGAVVEQEFADFLARNRMAGVIVARPRSGS